ncbi:MAG: hypothetical protein KKB95_05400 [Gammaproteobacteria bacterium]|nr:hypothetical protein [Gammaproteobacteria bacterium]MBU1351310.1 hypothetical protein [Gammaproteobacteria bacterium]MBU1505085.1 hypothetical protein [Gammaproteobacteria bacterium]MBU1815331.1 hypothetical protein [Gammaproteobacteria bacterium]MBU2122284.1 hypothetical protein [Gammaproteobacteria bacterium]
MKRKIDPKDNANNIRNPNHGTNGTNLQYDQNQGNKGKQLNPNQKRMSTAIPKSGAHTGATLEKHRKLSG